MSNPALIKEAADAALVAENTTGAPAPLLFAQWALESGWGGNSPGNNCFGIKEYAGAFGRELLQTNEWYTPAELRNFKAMGDGRTAVPFPGSSIVTNEGKQKYLVKDWFATFPTLAACFIARGMLFSHGKYKASADAYAQDHDMTKLVKSMATTYATSPVYAETILKILGQQNVTIALQTARDPSGPIPT